MTSSCGSKSISANWCLLGLFCTTISILCNCSRNSSSNSSSTRAASSLSSLSFNGKMVARIGYRVQGVLVRNPFLALVGLLTWLALAVQIGHSQLVASTLPITDDLDRESLRLAINRSMLYLSKLPADRI